MTQAPVQRPRSWTHVAATAAVVAGLACTPPNTSPSELTSESSSESDVEPTPAPPPLPQPLIHHVGLNVVDPDASMEWYRSVWPEGEPSRLDGQPALRSRVRGTDPPQDFFHVFRRVEGSPAGAWDVERSRSVLQSPFWHIGTYEDTTALQIRFDRLGVTTVPMWATEHGEKLWRSGESPYRGMQTGDRIADMDPEQPREGGFGYIIGPDGELVETSGGPQARRGFDHVHLLHEAPWCAARWYVQHLGMRPPAQRNPATGETVEIRIPDPCDVAVAAATYPALEAFGTLRGPRATVQYGNGSMSAYPRQCRDGRCGEDRPLVSSEGHVLEHIGFLIPDLAQHVERLRDAGVRIVTDVHPFADTRAAMIAGPDVLLLHLVERPEPVTLGTHRVPRPNGAGHGGPRE